MKNLSITRKFTCAIFLLITSFNSFAQTDTIRPVHIGLTYPVSSNGLKAAQYTNRFSLHAIAGLSKNETALTIAGAANIIKQDARGVQIAGLLNAIGNSASGTQIAGFANIIRKDASGAQIAGFLNLSGSSEAVQVAGFSNITGNSKGLQVAGFLNKSKNANAQVAGFMNIAKNVKGVQVAGFMNIADSSDYPVALINFIKNGEKSVGISVDESLTSITTFRSGGRVLYGIVGVGYNFNDGDKSFYALEAGLGAHIPVVRNFRVNAEIVNQTLSDFKKGDYLKNTIRILPACRLGNRLEIFAGPTVNYVRYSQDKGFDFIDDYIWSKNGSRNFQGIFVGFNAGIQVKI
ncbi:hypothetical protein [Dyadobacter sp. NIV53]|uniref:hypothetical protein n=1 Tax=Dyadobacter sp. NIV53 TaxID=2861765 RepID=UPI001C88BA64|nr:hypothetical protein [Dyadobacter sp. NIV53]